MEALSEIGAHFKEHGFEEEPVQRTSGSYSPQRQGSEGRVTTPRGQVYAKDQPQ